MAQSFIVDPPARSEFKARVDFLSTLPFDRGNPPEYLAAGDYWDFFVSAEECVAESRTWRLSGEAMRNCYVRSYYSVLLGEAEAADLERRTPRVLDDAATTLAALDYRTANAQRRRSKPKRFFEDRPARRQIVLGEVIDQVTRNPDKAQGWYYAAAAEALGPGITRQAIERQLLAAVSEIHAAGAAYPRLFSAFYSWIFCDDWRSRWADPAKRLDLSSIVRAERARWEFASGVR